MSLLGKKHELGICLSGGGALGYAHIGVLKALEEENIVLDAISGASIGALIGVLYANGYSSDEILAIIRKEKFFKLSHLFRMKNVFTSEGITDISKVEEVLHRLLPHNSFEALKKAFHVSMVDLYKPECTIVSSGGNLVEAVIASSSLPVIFEPKRHQEAIYVDGGVLNNLPVEPLVKTCRRIIGIDLLHPEQNVELRSKMDIFLRVHRIMTSELQRKQIRKCHHHVVISGLNSYTLYDFDKLDELVALGYYSMKKYLGKQKRRLK